MGEKGDGQASASWSFTSSADMETSELSISSPHIHGRLSYKILGATPFFSDGKDRAEPTTDALFAAAAFWEEPMPIGVVRADLVVDGTKFVYDRFGGQDHNWGLVNWPEFALNWQSWCVVLGPYVCMGWTMVSMLDHKRYHAVLLSEGRKTVFFSKLAERSITEDYALVGLTYGGAVSSRFNDKPTGCVLELGSNKEKKEWKVEIEFTNVVYDLPTGGGNAYKGFIVEAKGV